MEAKILYPENLEGLELSFVETIYVIAFELEDEIRSKGKVEVFAELDLMPQQMSESVEKAFSQMHNLRSYALRLVLGDDVNVSSNTDKFNAFDTLESCFENAIRELKSRNMRVILAGNRLRIALTPPTVVQPRPTSNVALREQVEQLMAEVQLYAEKCGQTLKQLQALVVEIEGQDYESEGLRIDKSMAMDTAMVGGIRWPYRSAEVLHELGLTERNDIVEFFCDFGHFVQAEDITLLEWLVITTILRKEELLQGNTITANMRNSIRDLSLSIRTQNCLLRGGVESVADLVSMFSDGADYGCMKMRRIRNLGKRSFDEIIQGIAILDLGLKDDWCYVADDSPVGALDFDRRGRDALKDCRLRTVGQLYAACQDQNRFSGLRYVDYDLYMVALSRLKRYGFC